MLLRFGVPCRLCRGSLSTVAGRGRGPALGDQDLAISRFQSRLYSSPSKKHKNQDVQKVPRPLIRLYTLYEWAGPTRGAEGVKAKAHPQSSLALDNTLDLASQAQEGPTPRPRSAVLSVLRARRTVPARKPRGPLTRSPVACAQADGSAASASLL
eukprot:4436853-Prymnesium_polylepis.2